MDNNLQDWIYKHNNKLDSSWNDQGFIESTIKQINKDFSPFCSEEISLEISNQPELKRALTLKIEEVLLKMEQTNSSSVPQLLYVIDIPENLFKEILDHSDSFYLNLAEVILVREAFKVWLRLNY